MPELGGSRPDRLVDVRPQERVQQHPVDQIVDTAPALPILDLSVPLMCEQLVDVLRFFDTLCLVAEQVIDVPKSILEDIPARRLCREPQLVEQLVDEPVPSFDDFDLVEEAEEEEEQPRMVSWVSCSRCSWPFLVSGCGPGEGVLVDDRHNLCTVHPSRRGSPPGQGGIQILAIMLALVGDVFVTMQRHFQQFHSSYATVTVAGNCGGLAVAVGSRNALFDSGYMFCVSTRATFGIISGFLRVRSIRLLSSTLVLLFSMSEVAALVVDHSSGFFSSGFAVMTHLAGLAEWRSVHSRCFEQFFLENLDIFL